MGGIRTGKLEYREGSIWGNPYLRLLRRQLEKYIVEEPGLDHLSRAKNLTGLCKIEREIINLKKRLDELQARRMELEKQLKKDGTQ